MARKPKKSEVTETKTSDVEVASAPVTINEEPEAAVESEAQAAPATDDVNELAKSLCGGELNAARQAQGLTVQDVAKQLRLGVRQVEALEQDDFSSLPEATIVKGFIRNYAKLLKIPSAPLIQAYTDLQPEKEQHAFALNPGINMKITESKKSSKSRYFIFTLLLILGAGVWFFYQNYVQKPSPVNPIPEIVEALPELALPQSERALDGESQVLEMPAVPAEPSDVGAVSLDKELTKQPESVKNDVAEDAATDELQPATEEPVATQPAPVAGKTRLEINATQETWVSIVNASGKEVYNNILYAGNHEVIDLWHPSQIVFGNAHGATLKVDGKSIDLAPYTRINVARVNLNR